MTEQKEILSAKEASEEVLVSYRLILAALKSGELKGRNLRGRRGWVITRSSLYEWIANGND